MELLIQIKQIEQDLHLYLCRQLLKNNADVNKYEQRQHTSLRIVSSRGNIEVVIILLCDPNIETECQFFVNQWMVRVYI